MISVLYVDDEEVLLEVAKIYLEQSGEISVDTATSALIALQRIGQAKYDVIISDYQMPEMDGIALLKHLRSKGDQTPFIIFTGRGREEVVIEALNSGADFYLQKGGEPRSQFVELQSKVQQATYRKRAEERVRYLNRVYALLSQVNQSIVRIHTQKELFRAICAIAVEQGRFRMAWIGLADPAAGILRPVAASGIGAEEYTNTIHISLAPGREGNGPSGRALREGTHIICNDAQNDPSMEPWRDLAMKFGYASLAAFPFRGQGEIIGTLNLYARERQFFSEEEERLLDEVSADISFSLKTLEKNQAHLAAVEALRQSEEQYHTLFQTMAQGVVYQSADGRITSANPAAERILGLTLDQMLGRTSVDPRWKAVREDGTDFPGSEYYSMLALSTGLSQRGIMGVFNPSEDRFHWMIVTAIPQFQRGETAPFRVFSTFEDITERKRIEDARSWNEGRFRIIFDIAPSPNLSITRQGIIVDCNQRIYDLLGYRKAEIIGRPMEVLVHPDHRARLDEILPKTEVPGDTRTTALQMVRKNGSRIDVSISSTDLMNKEGKILLTICILEDITEPRQATCGHS